jgi:hypothetical protein
VQQAKDRNAQQGPLSLLQLGSGTITAEKSDSSNVPENSVCGCGVVVAVVAVVVYAARKSCGSRGDVGVLDMQGVLSHQMQHSTRAREGRETRATERLPKKGQVRQTDKNRNRRSLSPRVDPRCLRRLWVKCRSKGVRARGVASSGSDKV